ncbi:hypothetical protein AHAS_Ahas10G0094600 [Arachis hypogaea]
MAHMKILRSALQGYPPPAQAQGPPDSQADRDADMVQARHGMGEREHLGGANAIKTHKEYWGRIHLVKQDSGLHLKGRKKRGNELICRFRPAPDAIRLASQIRHSSSTTSARFQPLAGADSSAEVC